MASTPDILSLPFDAIHNILSSMPLPTLIRFRSTCRLADALAAEHIDHRIKTVLAGYFTDIPGLFAVLSSTSSVISGSAAFAVCAPHNAFTPGDIDIYTPKGQSERMVDYLVEKEGFEVVGTSRPFDKGVKYRGGIKLMVQLKRDEYHIDVVESLTRGASLPIAHFWTTTVMLFITGTGICVLYPQLLERSRGLMTPVRVLDADGGADDFAHLVVKYKQRGVDIRTDERSWDNDDDPQPLCTSYYSPACGLTFRWVGDVYSLVTAFGTITDRTATSAFTGLLETVTTVWWRGGRACGPPCSAFTGMIRPNIYTQMRRRVEHAKISQSE